MSRLLVVGDLHIPYTHPGYFAFCEDLYEEWGCDRIHFIGDVTDWHAISFHLKHPDLPAAGDEYMIALDQLDRWKKRWPKATVSIGNHDERIYKLARSVGIPDRFIKGYRDIWETPGWTWEERTKIDDMHLMHGTGAGGIHPAYQSALRLSASVCIGHVHTAGGVKWIVGPDARHFGMDVGTGIDDHALAFAYAMNNLRKSVVSAGLVIDGHPYHEAMPLSRGEKYHRSRFKKGK